MPASNKLGRLGVESLKWTIYLVGGAYEVPDYSRMGRVWSRGIHDGRVQRPQQYTDRVPLGYTTDGVQNPRIYNGVQRLSMGE